MTLNQQLAHNFNILKPFCSLLFEILGDENWFCVVQKLLNIFYRLIHIRALENIVHKYLKKHNVCLLLSNITRTIVEFELEWIKLTYSFGNFSK